MSCSWPGIYLRATVPFVSSDGISQKVFSEAIQKRMTCMYGVVLSEISFIALINDI